MSCLVHYKLFRSSPDLYPPDANSSAHYTLCLWQPTVYLDFATVSSGVKFPMVRTTNFGLSWKVIWAFPDHSVWNSVHFHPLRFATITVFLCVSSHHFLNHWDSRHLSSFCYASSQHCKLCRTIDIVYVLHYHIFNSEN